MRRQSILELFQSNFQLEGQSGPLVAAVKVTLRRTQHTNFSVGKKWKSTERHRLNQTNNKRIRCDCNPIDGRRRVAERNSAEKKEPMCRRKNLPAERANRVNFKEI